jgi:TetR/AcrR family transcriptional regulator, transcriptional repressor for nem operon
VPREREFDEAEVLDRVANTFSSFGYGGTSVAMLASATGLGKQSLYNAFGDKRALYLLAVERAVARYRPFVAALENGATGRDGIDRYFERLVDACGNPDRCVHSCIVNSGLLEDIDDELIGLTLRTKWRGTQELLRQAVERGQRDGSIVSAAPSSALADVLMNLTSGLRVMAKSASRDRLAAACRLALAALDSP